VKLLIIGGDTEVGLRLAERLHERQINHLAITEVNPVMQNLKILGEAIAAHNPTQVVNLYSHQLFQTDDPANHKRAIECVKYLAKACNAHKLPLIHLSDADIYAGKSTGLYSEQDKPDNSERRAKRLRKAESYVHRRVKKHIILRTAAVFSAQGDNLFVNMMAAISGEALFKYPANSQICPTSAADVARVITAVCEQLNCQAECWGIYHYSSSEPTSLPVFAEAVTALASQFGDVHTDHLLFSKDEVKEANIVLSCRKLKHAFGIKQRPWRESLPETVREYCMRHSAAIESTLL